MKICLNSAVSWSPFLQPVELNALDRDDASTENSRSEAACSKGPNHAMDRSCNEGTGDGREACEGGRIDPPSAGYGAC